MNLKTSWVKSANNANTDFPLNNLPYGVFSINGAGSKHRCGVAIGDQIFDVATAEKNGLITLEGGPYLQLGVWNPLMAAGSKVWNDLRIKITNLLASDAGDTKMLAKLLYAQSDATLHLPISVSEYTDFYASKNHATNVGTMFRGAENALPPNWLSIPIGYNGRASSVVVSGAQVVRPHGQLKGPNDDLPRFAPCARFDFELEFGAIVGAPSNTMVSVEEADDMIFGYVLLNDWSARDIQAWEYQPLGPFQSKATATTISPWIVTKTALEQFRTPTPKRERELLPYLMEKAPMLYNIELQATLITQKQKDNNQETVITNTNYNQMYYSAAQQLCHHTTSGCAMRTGDLLGSGTISGTTPQSRGSLLELSWGGKEPMTLANGEVRTFLEDGDTITLRGAAIGDGFKIGFGECAGQIMPAEELPKWAK